MFNYSFWADEGYISGIASQLVNGRYSVLQAFHALSYQKLYILLISLSFKLFGVSELSARLPSMIAFIFGILVVFLLARKLSNIYGGFLSMFLYTFSYLNLAYATQARPYSILETIMLSIILLIVSFEKEKNQLRIFLYHFSIIVLLTIATFLHSIGVLLWTIYLVYIVITFKRSNIKNVILLVIILAIASIAILPIALLFINDKRLLPYNNLYQLVKLFLYKYSFISASAFFGFIWTFKKHKSISIAILFYSLVIFFMTGFRVYIFNIRYVLSIFGVIFLYFGIFWAKVGEKYMKKKAWVFPFIAIVLLYTTGYKITRLPRAYYNPNIDKYGDVQIANYKDFYEKLKQRFPKYKNLYVINDTFDVEYWYFGRYSDDYFMKFIKKPIKHSFVNAMVYNSLKDFKVIIKKHPKGILIMEDWQSFLPDDIKEYSKRNLKLEFRIESLKEAPDDPWPLALYSWGMK